jgi:hypothetical protein
MGTKGDVPIGLRRKEYAKTLKKLAEYKNKNWKGNMDEYYRQMGH